MRPVGILRINFQQLPVPISRISSLKVKSAPVPCADSAIPYQYDRSRTQGADRPLRRRQGRIQATGPRAGPGRRPRAPAAARAAGPPDRARRSWSSSIASNGAFPAPPRRRSAQRRDNLAAGRLDLHRDGYGFVRPNAKQAVGRRRYLHSAQRNQRRHAGRPGARRSRAAQSRRPHAGPHRAHSRTPQPHRRRHVSLRAIRIAATGNTSSFPSTSA